MRTGSWLGALLVAACGSNGTAVGADGSVDPQADAVLHDAPIDARVVSDIDAAVARYEDPLLFVRTRDGVASLFLAREDGTNAIELVDGEQPAWAPGRSAIAFSFREDDGFHDFGIYVLTPGASATRLATGRDPTWSPDGTRIVYAVREGLASMNADGTNQTLLLRTADVPYPPPPVSQDDFPIALWNPVFAPDGTTIAFDVSCSHDLYADAMWFVDSDGTDPRSRSASAYGWFQAWSPDSQRVVNASVGLLEVFDVASGDLTTIVDDDRVGSQSRSTWLSGGARLAFSAFRRTPEPFVRRIYSVASIGGMWAQVVPEDVAPGVYDDNDPQFAP